MVQLTRMTQAEYDLFYPIALQRLAEELSKARDVSLAKGIEQAKKSFNNVFPDGDINVADQYIFNIIANNAQVGILQFGIKRDESTPEAYIWDLEVKPEYRGMGYGEAAMIALEKLVKELKVYRIRLNVFGHNSKAIALYKKINYEIVSMSMVKRLDQ